ncbi:FKBP-type peptidyl-prolyl cis-trans isomerase [Patulibacter sp.]|uniref:FKBP-type peptidyl-prolyl cis-trans isomerase n=1 Tax=Patulibacter sp. TaxID=1912859 RepID=UPI0027156BE9|nr:FKBP-type peptidyl-prolyl cis-trans isomerase [Patulibacter sp.]MDO9410324.1 FKBP-type peptidyl-prolyl cis-trans isomerase [Patulibacter sp.]
MISPRRLLPLPLLLLALAGAGCGDERTAQDVESGGTEAATTAEGTSTAATTTEAAPTSTESGSGASASAEVKTLADGVGDDLKTAPTIKSPSGTPPSSLVSEDIVEGKGTPAKLNDNVEVRYTLVNWGGDDSPVDSSWTRSPNSTSFPLEEGGLIEGWIKGVPGMKPGGRRLLVVPAAQGYGDQGTPDGSVPPGGTLIFVIDLVKAS